MMSSITMRTNEMTHKTQASFQTMKLIANLSEIDQKAIHQAGIPAETLMELAGEHVAQSVQAHCNAAKRGVIVCGPGNNGGDGFVCARKLYQAGFQNLTVIHTSTTYKNEALANFEKILLSLPLPVINAKEQTELAVQQIGQADFIVDALFGSGLARPIANVEARLVRAINQAKPHAWVLAVDLPSGIDGDTGQVLGCSVQADSTFTFAAGKPGLFLHPGKAHAGTVSIVDIGIPARLLAEDESPIRLITTPEALTWLPLRLPDSHKYSHGHVLIIAGSQKMPGAAVLSSEAAMSAGAGLVTLAAPESVYTQMPIMPEITRLPLPDPHHLSAASLPVIEEAMASKRFNAVVIGPGLGNTPETFDTVITLLEALKSTSLSVIVDADGLNALSQSDLTLNERFILTPHIGECARLLHAENSVILSNLILAAQQVREKYGAQVVLKSASTVIATLNPDDSKALCWISPTGNPGMATAGSGDVLSGVIGAVAGQLHAQNQPVWQAATLGVYLHGLAGDAAATALTEYAMRASHITRHLPQAFKILL